MTERQTDNNEVVAVDERTKAARLKVLESDKVAQANREAAEAIETGEVFYGGTK
ncbi:MAG: hypothetical protein QY322_02295 [bacterium]|nr:MAG: hypothetical protein QY322_02295 [bacterium]